MGLSSFSDLRQWFFASVKGKGETLEAAPHWNLYAGDYGAREVRIMSNTRINDMDDSYNMLEQSIRAQNNPDGTRFRVQTYAPSKANNPTSETYVQIYEKSAAPAATPAAIAGIPAGVGSIQQYVDEKLETARLKWEIEQLREQMNAPSSTWERMLDTIGAIPGIDKVLQTAILGIVSKFSPGAMPAIQTAMNGTPEAVAQTDETDGDPEHVFAQNIHESAAMLQTDPVTLSKKLHALIKANPDMARQLMQ